MSALLTGPSASISSFLSLFVLAVGLGCQAPAAAAGPPLRAVKTIVLDPGHGGTNEGAKGVSGETLEKVEVLEIARAIRAQLERDYPDLKVVLTRDGDDELSLPDRIFVANACEADLFISLHLNASRREGAKGVEVFTLRPDMTMPLVTDGEGSWGQGFVLPSGDSPIYGPADTDLPVLLADLDRGAAHVDSALVAEVILSELVRTGPNRVNRGVRQANFGVLRGAQVPAVVVEFGFLSNRDEERWLRKTQTRRALGRAVSRSLARIDRLFYTKGYRPRDTASPSLASASETPPTPPSRSR